MSGPRCPICKAPYEPGHACKIEDPEAGMEAALQEAERMEVEHEHAMEDARDAWEEQQERELDLQVEELERREDEMIEADIERRLLQGNEGNDYIEEGKE